MDKGLRSGVEVAVAAVEGVVDFPSPRVGGDGLSGPCPVGFWCEESDADGSHQGITVASSDGLFGHLLLPAGDIADDLGPKPALRPASDSDEPVDRGAVAVEELEDLSNAKADAFIDCTEQVTALVLQRQPSDDSTGAWIKDRRAFAGEIWQQEEAA